jgi:hypothetical protein
LQRAGRAANGQIVAHGADGRSAESARRANGGHRSDGHRRDVTVEEWYFGLVSRLARQLRLQADEQAWWQAHIERSPVQRFSDFVREIALEEIHDPIVVFIDEIDSTLRLKFTDDFFGAIRAMYNARSSDTAYRRLAFVLLRARPPI